MYCACVFMAVNKQKRFIFFSHFTSDVKPSHSIGPHFILYIHVLIKCIHIYSCLLTIYIVCLTCRPFKTLYSIFILIVFLLCKCSDCYYLSMCSCHFEQKNRMFLLVSQLLKYKYTWNVDYGR